MPSFRGDESASSAWPFIAEVLTLPFIDLQELKGLEALEYQMTRSLDDLRQRRASAKFSNTFRGKLVNVGGRLFSLYCLVRYFSVRIICLSRPLIC